MSHPDHAAGTSIKLCVKSLPLSGQVMRVPFRNPEPLMDNETCPSRSNRSFLTLSGTYLSHKVRKEDGLRRSPKNSERLTHFGWQPTMQPGLLNVSSLESISAGSEQIPESTYVAVTVIKCLDQILKVNLLYLNTDSRAVEQELPDLNKSTGSGL